VDGGLALVDQALVAEADAAFRHADRGHMLRRLERWADAEDAFRRAVQADPAYAPGHYGLGLILAARGQEAAGAACRARALAMLPQTEEAMAGLDALPLNPRFRSYAYVEDCRANGREARVVLGGHWGQNRGWLILGREEQDITKPLMFEDESIDVLFTEQVIDHIPVTAAAAFFKEARRVLKPGGTLRTVCPMLERILEPVASGDSDSERRRLEFLCGRYSQEMAPLDGAGPDARAAHAGLFRMNELFREPGRQFVWSARLMSDLLTQAGFPKVAAFHPGEGHRREICIERNPGLLPYVLNADPDFRRSVEFDRESLAVEAVK